MTEHAEQCALFDWANVMQAQIPQLANMFAIPNGGHRHKATAGKLKAEGVKAGVPDIALMVPSQVNGVQWHGMFIEMKYGRNVPSQYQKEWLGRLEDSGYYTVIAHSFEQAQDAILEYLGI